MNRLHTIAAAGLWLAAATLPAHAQSAPSTPAAAAATPPAAAPATAPAKAASGAPATKSTPAPAGASKPGTAKGSACRAMDRLDLDTTQITGNRELPKVMVVVPWKKSDIGDLVGRPVNSLVDEALEPVDREVFRREVDYYGALAPDRPGAAANRSETAVTPDAGGPRSEK